MKNLIFILPLILVLGGCGIFYEQNNPVRDITAPEINITTVVIEENLTQDEGIRSTFAFHPGNLTIYFLDKQGFSAAIITPQDNLIIIDTGLSRTATENFNSIKDLGYNKASILIVTGIRSYRIGGIPVLVSKLNPDKGYFSGLGDEGYEDYRLVKDYISNFTTVSQDKLILVDDLEFRFLVAYDDGTGFRIDNTQNSVLVKIIYKDFNILFGSDCYDECEDRISIDSDLSADVFAMPLMGRCEDDLGVSTFILRTVGATMNIGSHLCEKIVSKLDNLGFTYHDQQFARMVITSDGTGYTFYLVE